MSKPLTAQAIERLKPNATKRLEIPDGLLPGFYLVVQPSGAKSWAVRYRHGGKPRKLTLGSYPALDLSAARTRAREALQDVAAGADPAANKQEARKQAREGDHDRDRVSALFERYLERQTRTKKSAGEVERIFRKEVLPSWGERRIRRSAGAT